MSLRNNGEVPFPLAGEGYFLRFNLRDIEELEAIYGVGEYLETVDKNLQQASGGTLLKCVTIGLKKRDDAGKVSRVGFAPEDINFSVLDAHPAIMDALCLQACNMTYGEMLEGIQKRQAEIERFIKEHGEAPPPEKEPEDDPLKTTAA